MTVTASTDSVDQIRAPLDRCLSEPQAAERAGENKGWDARGGVLGQFAVQECVGLR